MPRWDLAGHVVARMTERNLRRDCGIDTVPYNEGLAVVGKCVPLQAGRARINVRRRDGYLYQLWHCGVLLRH